MYNATRRLGSENSRLGHLFLSVCGALRHISSFQNLKQQELRFSGRLGEGASEVELALV